MEVAGCKTNLSAPPWLLKTPEELQRQFIREKHGGARGETSNGVEWCSTEENLHATGQRFSGVNGHMVAAWHHSEVTANICVNSLVTCRTVLKHLPSLTFHLWATAYGTFVVYFCLYRSSCYNRTTRLTHGGCNFRFSSGFFNAIPGCWFRRLSARRSYLIHAVFWGFKFQEMTLGLWFLACKDSAVYSNSITVDLIITNSHCNKARKQTWMWALITGQPYSITSAVTCKKFVALQPPREGIHAMHVLSPPPDVAKSKTGLFN